MGIFDRVVLTLYTFCLGVISALVFTMAMGWLVPLELLRTSLNNVNGRWLVGSLSFVSFVASLRLLLSGVRRYHGRHWLTHEAELGTVTISLGAVENLVKKAARQVKGVREVKAAVRVLRREGIAVQLRAAVSPDLSIPDVSSELQKTVRNYVQNVVGVPVANVRVFVQSIAGDLRTRLE